MAAISHSGTINQLALRSITPTVNCVKLKKEAKGLLVPSQSCPKRQWFFGNVFQEIQTA